MKSPLTESELRTIRQKVSLAEGVAVALLFALTVIVLAIFGRPVAAAEPPWSVLGSPSISVTAGCSIASINSGDNSVTVDWECVRQKDLEFSAQRGGPSEMLASFAHVMKAIHDGTAKAAK